MRLNNVAVVVGGAFVGRAVAIEAGGIRARAPQATPAPASPTSAPAAGGATPSLTFASTGPSAVPLVSITANAATAVTDALHPTLVATPGAHPPLSGAPPLPSWTFTPGTFPALDQVPPTNTPQVSAWIQQVQNSGVTIPNYQPTVANATCAGNTAAAADQSSYDDGPSDYTADLLNFMDDNKLKSTFFIVGSRAISRPNILQAEYMAGHQLSVHTWSHPSLTTLTNEQIIAELGWTREAIRQITGVSPNTMRPPYGDIDDRVRAIAQAMGMTPIIWTGSGTNSFDTNDWHIPSGQSVYSVIQTFDGILQTATTLPTGFIVLAHDLYQQTVELATSYILPDALARRNPQFNLMSIIQCQHKPLEDAYVETNNNATNPFASNALPLTGSAAVQQTGASSSGAPAPTGAGASTQNGGGKPNGAVGRQVGAVAAAVGGVFVGAVMLLL
ncbi:chitin deacetylase [Tulasnella sp. 403]|nr:chitin deacetylase [Tulasnella sp. 403]